MTTTCDHAESLYGRCTTCDMTWEQQTVVPRVGMVFEHARRMDPYWTPGPGQTYWQDGPPEVYRVTRITKARVYYRALEAYKTDDFISPERFASIVKRVLPEGEEVTS